MASPTQLLIAPIAVVLEQRVDARLLTLAGFGLFAAGLGLSGLQTPQTDFEGMFWPQVIAASPSCLLAAADSTGTPPPFRPEDR
jgi:hypothetical protein